MQSLYALESSRVSPYSSSLSSSSSSSSSKLTSSSSEVSSSSSSGSATSTQGHEGMGAAIRGGESWSMSGSGGIPPSPRLVLSCGGDGCCCSCCCSCCW